MKWLFLVDVTEKTKLQTRRTEEPQSDAGES